MINKEKGVFGVRFIRVFISVSVAVFCFSLLFASFGVASATDYYVATWGSDSDGGTLEEPWKHPAYAAQVAEAGDTIYLLDGTWYNEHIVFANSGTATHPITLKAYSGTPTLDGVDKTGIGIELRDKSYISLSGFRMKNYGTGIDGEGLLQHISISDFTIEDIDAIGINLATASIQNSEIRDFTILRTSGSGIYRTGSSSGCFDVTISNFVIKGTVDNVGTAGIWWDMVKGLHIQHGEIHNVYHGVQLQRSIDDVIIDDVKVYAAGFHGICITDPTQGDYPCHDNIIRNCYVSYAGHNAIDLHSGAYNTLIENCELTGDASMGAGIYFHTEGSDLTVRDCTIYGASLADSDTFIGIDLTSRSNVLVENSKLYNLKRAIRGAGGDYTIRNNIMHSTLYPDTISLGNDNILCEGNDIGGGRYRINYGHGIVRNSLGNSYSVCSEHGATITVEYTDGKTFSVDGEGSHTSYVITSKIHSIEVLVTTGAISGVVTTTTGSPIEGATVTVEGAGESDETDGYGVYTITDVPVGTYTVTASAPEYEDSSVLSVVVKKDEITTINFQLIDEITYGDMLVGYWKFDEGSGNTARDSSGNNNDGAIQGASWTEGKDENGLSFDGTNDYVDCGQDTSLKITGAITVEAWVKWSGAGNPSFVTKTGGSGRRSYDLSGNDDGTAEFRVGGAGGSTSKSSGTASIPRGEWVHLAGTYEPSSYVRLFVNGTLVEEETASIPAAQGDNGLSWYIGAREGNQDWCNGDIDEVKIYNRALSEEEIKVDCWVYAPPNQPPFTPGNPSPSYGATDVPIDVALRWTCGDPDAEDTVTYDVYFGLSTTPQLVVEDLPGTTYDPGMLNCNTEYYWRVVAKDNHGASNEGEVWSFATASLALAGPVADWHLDEGTGATAVDSSGNGNDGTLVNSPTWVTGKVGKGLRFDGTNDYVDCGQSSSLKITGAITVEAWVKWSGAGNPSFVTKTGGSGRRSYDLSGNDDGTAEFRVGGAGGSTSKSSGTASIPRGEWVHLTGTYEPSSYVRLFVNGALAEEETASIPAAQGDNGLSWYIGAREGNQDWCNGDIDEVKIYNRALSEEEIKVDYGAYSPNKPPFTPGNPSPSYGATDVPIDVALSWTGGDPDAEDTVTYDVYFGSSTTPPLVVEGLPGTTYDPGMLNCNTEYYWRVVAKDNHGASNEGEVWTFATASLALAGPVADWHLDEGTGATAVDSSENGNDGTLVNNPTWVTGKVGKGLRFDGTNDYVDCGQSSSLKITGAITVEAWVKWSGAGNPSFVTKTGGSGRRSYDLSGNDDGTVEFRVGGAGGSTSKSSGSAFIPAGEWVHLTGTYEPSSYVRLFVNGTLAEEETTSIPAAQGDNGLSWYIGAREGNQDWFNGVIDEVKIYSKALSEGEIKAEYEAYYSKYQLKKSQINQGLGTLPPDAAQKSPYKCTRLP